MNLDIIVPIKPNLVDFAAQYSVPSILSLLDYKNLYLVSNRDTITKLKSHFKENVNYLDENKIVSGLDRASIESYFKSKKIYNQRSLWYFQQFIKMGVSKLDYISDKYLIWDADAIPLKKLKFFTNDKELIDITKEYHKPYFDTLKLLLGIDRKVTYSFISEHLIFRKEVITNMIEEISLKNDQHWWLNILDSINIDDLPNSGFSEYETYGNYISTYYQDTFKVRTLVKSRNGKSLFGMKPSKFQLSLLKQLYDYVSFEEWHKEYHPIKSYTLIVLYIIRFKLKNLFLKCIPPSNYILFFFH